MFQIQTGPQIDMGSRLVIKLPHKICQEESKTMSNKIIQLNEGAIKQELKELVDTA